MQTKQKIILKCDLPPGDLCTLTAAIESLHLLFPDQYLTDVYTNCDTIFQNNPRIFPLDAGEAHLIEMSYTEAINHCNYRPLAFLEGYARHLAFMLRIPLQLVVNRPYIYLTDEEKSRDVALPPDISKDCGEFWLINAGVKKDCTLKQWPVEYYQEVVDHFRDRIQFVQIGDAKDDHPALQNVINWVGKTTVRQLIGLCFHSSGGIGPITFLQHLCAAFQKPYIALLGGREPVNWTQYPLQTTLHTLGQLPCCSQRACWRSRVILLHDQHPNDKLLCEFPVLEMQRPVGKCMALIKPTWPISAIEAWYEGHSLKTLASSDRSR
jgi:hypothetical protein